ncbi:protein SOSEKI 3-like [Phragmites australis]|uniref:protein SOSEKI 3-like n=1 Tax=Phragmites australis TaxID=29695 RepID=UPI002D7659C6|nr:protein SOSEKI 3-like [Phragmites australis]
MIISLYHSTTTTTTTLLRLDTQACSFQLLLLLLLALLRCACLSSTLGCCNQLPHSAASPHCTAAHHSTVTTSKQLLHLYLVLCSLQLGKEGKERKAMSEEAAARDRATMEGRVRRPRASRSTAETGTATVVYYLCRNGRHLEHPHLMELPLASPNHVLYLRDVTHRLDALRGKGMAAMYSWSCKRRYKTGFVWHDVSGDDILLPAQGSEYVLKGSLLLLRHSPPSADHDQHNVDATIIPKVQCVKPTPEEESPARSRGSQEAGWTTNSSSSSPPMVEVEAPPPLQPHPQTALPSSPSSSSTTMDEEAARSSSSGSSSPNKPMMRGSGGSVPSSGSSSPSPPPSLMPYNKQQKPVRSSVIAVQDVATQTAGVSTGMELHRKDTITTSSMPSIAAAPTDDNEDGQQGGGHAAGSCSSSTSGRSGTLESLIRAEALGRRGACSSTNKRILLEEDESSSLALSRRALDKEAVQSLGAKLNPANLLMRLVACGSTMSARHHPACGLMRTTHKPRYLSHHLLELPPSSPVLSPLGSLITRPQTAAGTGVISQSGGDCGHCRGSVLQTAGKGDESGKGMPSSSYDQDSTSEIEGSKGNLDNLESISKILPQTIRMAPCEQSTSGTLVTTTTDVRHNSVEQECSYSSSSKTLSRSTSKRISDPSAGKIRSSRVVSFHDEKERVIKIEERLASGARVIIQCTPLLKESYVSTKAM